MLTYNQQNQALYLALMRLSEEVQAPAARLMLNVVSKGHVGNSSQVKEDQEAMVRELYNTMAEMNFDETDSLELNRKFKIATLWGVIGYLAELEVWGHDREACVEARDAVLIALDEAGDLGLPYSG